MRQSSEADKRQVNNVKRRIMLERWLHTELSTQTHRNTSSIIIIIILVVVNVIIITHIHNVLTASSFMLNQLVVLRRYLMKNLYGDCSSGIFKDWSRSPSWNTVFKGQSWSHKCIMSQSTVLFVVVSMTGTPGNIPALMPGNIPALWCIRCTAYLVLLKFTKLCASPSVQRLHSKLHKNNTALTQASNSCTWPIVFPRPSLQKK